MNSAKTSSGSASGSAARSKASPFSDAAIAVAKAGAGKRSSKPSCIGDSLERLREGVADRVAALGELTLKLGVADAERPELVEEQRPVGIGLEEGAKLIGGRRTRVALALRGIGDRGDLSDAGLDLTIGDR